MEVEEIADKLIAAFDTQDIEAIMSFFTEDAIFFDPHYPIQRMEGAAAIRQGIKWGLSNIEKASFSIRYFWNDEDTGAVEIDTHHILKGGIEVNFDQVFVFELENGKIKRLQSYVSYAPPGVRGFIPKVMRLIWRLKGKI